MSLSDRRDLDPCGCCELPVGAAPLPIWNRPALGALAYRVGTYASLRQAMLDAIAAEPALREWTTRRSDDYGIALVEMWAYLGDILTFYHERATNEAFLRTALHRDSVLRLAGLLGYQPAPGVAAVSHLAFTLEREKKLQIPVELRVQSVPEPGEKPQKFETVEAIAADARLNRVRVYPEPTDREPLAPGSDWAILDPTKAELIRATLSRGDRFLVSRTGVADWAWEDKEVVALDPVDGYQVLHWKPVVQGNQVGASAHKYVRKFRLFGHDAPPRRLAAWPDPSTPTGVVWAEIETDFGIPAETSSLELEGIYDDIKPGANIIVVGCPVVTAAESCVSHLSTVIRVTTTSATLSGLVGEPLNSNEEVATGVVTQITLEAPTEFTLDRRAVFVYLLEGPEIEFWPFHFDPEHETLKKGSGVLHLRPDLVEILNKRRSLILDDGTRRSQRVSVSSRSIRNAGGVDHLRLAFEPRLERDLDAGTAVVYGNVARATHGETIEGEVLGDGDAARDFQRFDLRKSPLTHVPDPTAPRGAGSTLDVRVNGIRWQEVATLYGQPPDAPVYRTHLDDAGVTTLQFGDGRTGARLPSGRANLTASYRQGLGRAGRVAAGALSKPLDRPTGLKAVTNPAAAEGGADPETLAEARRNAPNTVRTFGRVVSLRDFEDAAREYEGIAKARADWYWTGRERIARLAVAPEGGASLGDEMKADLIRYLDRIRTPHRRLQIQGRIRRPLLIVLRAVSDPDYEPEDVEAALRAALLEHFAFDNRGLGEGMYLSDLYEAVHRVEGVVAADVDALIFKPDYWSELMELWSGNPSSWLTWLALWFWSVTVLPVYLEHLKTRGMRFSGDLPEAVQPRLPVYAHEILSLDVPLTDLWIQTVRASR